MNEYFHQENNLSKDESEKVYIIKEALGPFRSHLTNNILISTLNYNLIIKNKNVLNNIIRQHAYGRNEREIKSQRVI